MSVIYPLATPMTPEEESTGDSARRSVMSDQERVTLTLTRREVELTAAAIDLMADLMAGGDRERELRPLFATIIRQAREQINEQ